MNLEPVPYRSDYERQCFPLLSCVNCVDVKGIQAADISQVRSYLFSSGHVVNNRPTSNRENIGFFDSFGIRLAATKYLSPRELICRILESRILQGGRLIPLSEDDDLRDAIDALDSEHLRDREMFQLLYAADTFPDGVRDEFNPTQIHSAFKSLQESLRKTNYNRLRKQPAIRNFVLTRLRQRHKTPHPDIVMREFIITLDLSRLTQGEVTEIMNSVRDRGPTNSAECGPELRRYQTLLRYENKMANEIMHRRYEPDPADDNILRLVLAMLNVPFVEDTEDARFQVIQAMAEDYNSCDELLCPRPIDDMTFLCLQINLCGIYGTEVMTLDEDEQTQMFAIARAELQTFGGFRGSSIPEWLETTRLERMVELWDGEGEPLNTGLHTVRQTREAKQHQVSPAAESTGPREDGAEKVMTSRRRLDSIVGQTPLPDCGINYTQQPRRVQSTNVDRMDSVHYNGNRNKQNIQLYQEYYEPEWQNIHHEQPIGSIKYHGREITDYKETPLVPEGDTMPDNQGDNSQSGESGPDHTSDYLNSSYWEQRDQYLQSEGPGYLEIEHPGKRR